MSDVLGKVPSYLRIKIVHSDEHIIVVHKPSLLRSVPGTRKENHNADISSDDGGASKNNPIDNVPKIATGQEAWTEAMLYYQDEEIRENAVACEIQKNRDKAKHLDAKLMINVKLLLKNLAAKPKKAIKSIPRRKHAFEKYVTRNAKTILPHLLRKNNASTSNNDGGDASANELILMMKEASYVAFDILKRKSISILDIHLASKKTKDEESALGQINLLFKTSDDIKKEYGEIHPGNQYGPIHVVHRLDCETSGLLVFARTADAASFLSKAWRERKVSKTYLAQVQSWPPFQEGGQMSGVINLPLGPMKDDRLRWEVRDENHGGKPSQSLWKVLMENNKIFNENRIDGQKKEKTITLELKPISGRTHQLRIHCASTNESGIIGDSLYGPNTIDLKDGLIKAKKIDVSLRLHAYMLSFPHPSTTEKNFLVHYKCNHDWGDNLERL